MKEIWAKVLAFFSIVEPRILLIVAVLVLAGVVFQLPIGGKVWIYNKVNLGKSLLVSYPSLFASICLFGLAVIILRLKEIVFFLKNYLYYALLVFLGITSMILFEIRLFPPLSWYDLVRFFFIVLIFEALLIYHKFTCYYNKLAQDRGKPEDSPLTKPEEDKLSRAWFSENIFKMILRLPDDNMRIAIKGEWGSGKTTCLNFIGEYAILQGYPVVHFNVWKYETSEEAWKGFVASVDSGIAKSHGITIGPFKQTNILIKTIKLILSSHQWFGGIGKGFQDLFLSRLEASFDETKEYVSQRITKQLSGKKIIVLIDDLDRSDRTVLYRTLVMIKEVIDVRGCVFICGFDEKATFDILDKFNITDKRLFMDKIFQWQFDIPEPKVYNWDTFLDDLLQKYTTKIQAMNNIRKVLPKNPRKLKGYLRTLDSLHNGFLFRFGDDDLNWDVLYIAELLKAEFPEALQIIIEEPAFLKWSELLLFGDGRLGNELRSEWQKKVQPLFLNEEGLWSYFNLLTEKLCTLSLGLNREHLRYHIRVLNHPEVLTWKEYREWKSKERLEILNRLLDSRLPIEQRREFLRTLMKEREIELRRETEAVNREEREQLLDNAIVLTNEAEWYISKSELHDGAVPIFDASVVKDYLENLQKWANLKTSYYSNIRDLEIGIAIKLAEQSKNLASELLPVSPIIPSILQTEPDLFEDTRNTIVEIYCNGLADKLIKGLEIQNTIKNLWGESSHWREKKLFSSLNPYFYKPENIERLENLADHALENDIIHSNFLEIMLMLLYAIEANSSFNSDEALNVLQNDEIREMFWRAVTVRRIDRINIGRLLKGRQKLTVVLDRTDIMNIPSWVYLDEPELVQTLGI